VTSDELGETGGLLASVLTGVCFGLVPAFHAASANPGQALGEGERGSTGRHSRDRSILIAVEVGLSLVLLIGAGLTVRSFSKLTRVDPGFTPERLLIFDLGPSFLESERQNIFYHQIVQRLQSIAGVERVGAVSRLPLSGGNSGRTFNLAGNEQEYNADVRVSTPDYFRTMGIPLLKGRTFSNHDVKGSLPVAVINQALATTIFRGEDAIVSAAQNAVPAWDKNVALGNVRTMHDAIASSVMKRKFTMLLLTIFAGLAVVLATIGLYGVMSYSVSQRTREIGIRMAVGAQRTDVLKLIVRQGMLLTGMGVLAGLIASFGLTRLMSSLLYGISATDAVPFAALSALLLGVALLACWLPARRASSVDPMVALRAE
jgi:hypothetical protein